jgi:hypothetical protein
MSGLLESLNIIVSVLIYPFMACNICFMKLGAPTFHTSIFTIIISSLVLVINLFLVGMGFEIRTLYLLGKLSATQAMSPALFALVYMSGDVSLFPMAGLGQ